MSPELQIKLQQAIKAFQVGDLIGSEKILRTLLKSYSNYTDALHLLAVVLASQGNHLEAIEYYRNALKIAPNDAAILSNYGSSLNLTGQNKEAFSALEKAIQLNPGSPEFCYNAGNILYDLGKFEQALKFYERATILNNQYFQAHNNYGKALFNLRRFSEALIHYDKALSLNPAFHDAWVNKAITLHDLKRYDEALPLYDEAIRLNPSYAEAWYNKALTLKELSLISHARASFDKAIEFDPNYSRARWAKLFSTIPSLFTGSENLGQIRNAFTSELDQLDNFFRKNGLEDVSQVIGVSQPFYLAYQELNNKDLLAAYGKLCSRLMGKWQQEHHLQAAKKRESGKIRIGIISGHIHNHSVWNAIIKGWLEHLDDSLFEIHLFSLGIIEDEESNFAKMKAASFTSHQASLLDWAKEITSKNIEVLIYPEVGMNQLTTQLANLRLAPIQVVSWGHPESTGFPTIDYYLSAELFEDEYSQSAYTENLVRLPNLGCSYSKLPITASKFAIENFGINANELILVCPGALFKYAPQYDWVLIDIAKRLGKCKFIFFEQQKNWSKFLKDRLDAEFQKANLAIEDFVVFIPWLSPEDFYGLMQRADLFLDSLGFSGFNTAMQAIDCALPIVTKEGKFMRGRLASGILKRMSMPELIAKTDQEYIDLVVRLSQDKAYRDQISNNMIEKREVLYDDLAPIKALENFLVNKARG